MNILIDIIKDNSSAKYICLRIILELNNKINILIRKINILI